MLRSCCALLSLQELLLVLGTAIAANAKQSSNLLRCGTRHARCSANLLTDAKREALVTRTWSQLLTGAKGAGARGLSQGRLLEDLLASALDWEAWVGDRGLQNLGCLRNLWLSNTMQLLIQQELLLLLRVDEKWLLAAARRVEARALSVFLIHVSMCACLSIGSLSKVGWGEVNACEF